MITAGLVNQTAAARIGAAGPAPVHRPVTLDDGFFVPRTRDCDLRISYRGVDLCGPAGSPWCAAAAGRPPAATADRFGAPSSRPEAYPAFHGTGC